MTTGDHIVEDEPVNVLSMPPRLGPLLRTEPLARVVPLRIDQPDTIDPDTITARLEDTGSERVADRLRYPPPLIVNADELDDHPNLRLYFDQWTEDTQP